MGKVKVRSVHRKIRVSGRMLRRIDFCWFGWREKEEGGGGEGGTGERRPAGTGDGQTRKEHGERRGEQREREKERKRRRQYGRKTGRQHGRFVMTSKFGGEKVGRW